jgi:hypothetical protein
MRKLLLASLVIAAPMLVAPSSASVWGWGWGYGYGYAPRYHGLQLLRTSLAFLRAASGHAQIGMGRGARLTPLVVASGPCRLITRALPVDPQASHDVEFQPGPKRTILCRCGSALSPKLSSRPPMAALHHRLLLLPSRSVRFMLLHHAPEPTGYSSGYS